jgi:hypothetical protein
MGALNDGLEQQKGRVRGVIHARWVVDKVEHAYIADLVVVEGEDLQVSTEFVNPESLYL